jgi:hypothetical protein
VFDDFLSDERRQTGVLTSVIYLIAVAACLTLPTAGNAWGPYQGIVLTYAGIPLALASAAQGSIGERIVESSGLRYSLAGFWVVGCIGICVTSPPIENTVVYAVVCGGAVVAAATGLVVVAGRLAMSRSQVLPVRVLYVASLALYGIIFLYAGLRLVSSAEGGALGSTFTSAARVRVAVLSGIALILVAAVLRQESARRRRTRG